MLPAQRAAVVNDVGNFMVLCRTVNMFLLSSSSCAIQQKERSGQVGSS